LCAVAVALTLSPAAVVADSSNSKLMTFDGAKGWLNSKPLAPSDLSGKVVLVDVWEYTCVNCLRTLPYLKAWYSRYHSDGFEIIGVHTPEFGFSGDTKNVTEATKRLGITWPVALDDDGTIFQRYDAAGWPAEFLYDQKGDLVETQHGEGNYPQTEAKIQSLLLAKDKTLKLPAVMALLPQDSYDKPGAVCYPQTPEMFVGTWHGVNIANPPTGRDPSGDLNFTDSGKHTDNSIYLQGYWQESQDRQGMIADGSGDYLSLNYEAIQVVGVLKPENGGSQRVDVTQDGKPVSHDDAGVDLQFDSSGKTFLTVDAPRAYDIVSNKHYAKHELRLSPQRYGVGFYDFAFESCEVGSDK
jgi:thiol-disulfide isomerase/thioredoxin